METGFQQQKRHSTEWRFRLHMGKSLGRYQMDLCPLQPPHLPLQAPQWPEQVPLSGQPMHFFPLFLAL